MTTVHFVAVDMGFRRGVLASYFRASELGPKSEVQKALWYT